MPALIFDCDGVLADTERDGHLVAFNKTFEHFNLPVRWSVEDYAERLKIGGGKERLKSLFTENGYLAKSPWNESEDSRNNLIAKLRILSRTSRPQKGDIVTHQLK
jgi:beta-phosphoglucomutase-like phosphatase (HAD superfamily)